MVRSFKDLLVWQKSFALVKVTYKIAGDLPDRERFGLSSQLQRSAVSIPSNIAEGSERGTRKDYAQFLRIALGSSAELETQLLLANDLYNMNVAEVCASLTEVQKMLSAMIKSLDQTKT